MSVFIRLIKNRIHIAVQGVNKKSFARSFCK